MVDARPSAAPASDAAHRRGLTIPRELVAAILDHARSGLPNEACGVLSGSLQDGRATRFHPTRNEFESPLRYNVHPDDLLRVMTEIEEVGEELVATFHSHVASPAVPSETDRRQAFYPDTFYLVASLTDRARPELRGWRIRDGVVDEVEVEIE